MTVKNGSEPRVAVPEWCRAEVKGAIGDAVTLPVGTRVAHVDHPTMTGRVVEATLEAVAVAAAKAENDYDDTDEYWRGRGPNPPEVLVDWDADDVLPAGLDWAMCGELRIIEDAEGAL